MKGSQLKAYAVKAYDFDTVKLAYRKIYQLIPSASHVVAACSLPGFHEDDDEHGMGDSFLDSYKTRVNLLWQYI